MGRFAAPEEVSKGFEPVRGSGPLFFRPVEPERFIGVDA